MTSDWSTIYGQMSNDVAAGDSRNETISTVDKFITQMNDKFTSYPVDSNKLWSPDETKVVAMPTMEGTIHELSELSKVASNAAQAIRDAYAGADTSETGVLQAGWEKIQKPMYALESFADEYVPALTQTLQSGAETCNHVYQSIRTANHDARNTIAESSQSRRFLFMGGGEDMDNDSMIGNLHTNADTVNEGVTAVREGADHLKSIVDSWDTGVASGNASGTEGGLRDPIASDIDPGEGSINDPGQGSGGAGNGSGGVTPTDPRAGGAGSGIDDPFMTDPDTGSTGSGIEDPDTGDLVNPIGSDTPQDMPGLEDPGMGETLPGYDDGSMPELADPSMGTSIGESDLPDLADPISGDDGITSPDDVSTAVTGEQHPDDDELDQLFKDFEDEYGGIDGEDGGIEGPDIEDPGAGDIADPATGDSEGGAAGVDAPGTIDDEADDVFGTDIDSEDAAAGGAEDAQGDLPPGGASPGVDGPELGAGIADGSDAADGLIGMLTGEDTSGVVAEVGGEDVSFPDQKTADLAEAMQGEGGVTLRDAASDLGFNLPPEGQDIGQSIDPVDLRPGDVMSTSDGDYLYLGDEMMLDSSGETHEMEEVAKFDGGPAEGFFRMDPGDGSFSADQTLGAVAPDDDLGADPTGEEPTEMGAGSPEIGDGSTDATDGAGDGAGDSTEDTTGSADGSGIKETPWAGAPGMGDEDSAAEGTEDGDGSGFSADPDTATSASHGGASTSEDTEGAVDAEASPKLEVEDPADATPAEDAAVDEHAGADDTGFGGISAGDGTDDQGAGMAGTKSTDVASGSVTSESLLDGAPVDVSNILGN